MLHVIAGPVDAKAFLEEANWVISKTKQAIAESKNDATKFKALMRQYHADRLEEKYDVRVTPVLKDQIMQNLSTALAYRDSEGQHLAPVLPLPPLESPDRSRKQRQLSVQLPNGGQVHRLLAAHATMKIENLFGAIFEGILGERVTTKPVQADTPFVGRK